MPFLKRHDGAATTLSNTSSSSFMDSMRPSKKPRLMPATTDGASWDSVVLRQDNHAQLERLPAEILQLIFWYSKEPSLIHTNRRLRQILPSYVWYTKRLTFLAFCGHGDEEKLPVAVPAMQKQVLPFLDPPLDVDNRAELQRCIWNNGWFGTRQFDLLHVEITRALIQEVGNNPAVTFSRHQWSRVNRMLKEARRNPTWTANPNSLHMQIRSKETSIDIVLGAHFIDISTHPRPGPLTMQRVPIFDFCCIPDKMLQTPFTAGKSRLLVMIMKSKSIDQIKYDLVWNRSLVFQGIQDAIREHNSNVLRVLLDLDRIDLKPGEQRPVEMEHFRLAILLGNDEAIRELHNADGYLCGDPDLEALLEEALDHNGPNIEAVALRVFQALCSA